MAKKTALIIVGIIAATAMGVGAFVGSELGEPAAAPTATPTAVAGGGDAGGDTTPTASPTVTASPTPTVAPSEFNRTRIEHEIQTRVNAERRDRGIGGLSRFEVAVEMARFHSENMAAQGYPTHAAGGFTTDDRYEKYDIHDRCKLVDDSESGLRDGEELETIDKTIVGRPFERDGTVHYYRNESAVAASIVDGWLDDPDARQKLLYKNARQVGVGVVVTDDGDSYTTLDLCG